MQLRIEPRINKIKANKFQDIVLLTGELRNKDQEYLVCFYLDARGKLLKKGNIGAGSIDKTLIDPKEIFYPAVKTKVAGVILMRNHLAGDPASTDKDIRIAIKIAKAGAIK